MNFNAEDFLTQIAQGNKSKNALNNLRKDELHKVCTELGMATSSRARKAEILESLTTKLVEEGLITEPENNQEQPDETTEQESTAFQIRKMELEFELKLQQQKIEAEARLQLELLDRKLQAEKELEMERLRNNSSLSESHMDSSFLKTKSFVPKFSEKEVEEFFLCFERSAQMFDWPRDKWPLFVQTVLTGKAQRAYVALSEEDARDYDQLKKAILQAYELVPEAYRQKFRSWKKASHQTHAEFAKEKVRYFERWTRSANVSSMDDLAQLILLEEFKACTSPAIKIHLEDKEPKTLDEAAKMADSFDLSHRQTKFDYPKKSMNNHRSISPTEPDGAKADVKESNNSDPKRRECEYCKKKGHTKDKCWKLHGKPPLDSERKPRPVTFVGRRPMMPPRNVEQMQWDSTLLEREDSLRKEGELAFSSDGRVSTSDNFKESQKVRIWRDTGAFQSLIRKGTLNLNEKTFTGKKILITGIAGSIEVELHRILIESNIFNGAIQVGEVNALPIPGIDVILGNEVAGSKLNSISGILHSPEISKEQPENLLGDSESTAASIVCEDKSDHKLEKDTDAQESSSEEKLGIESKLTLEKDEPQIEPSCVVTRSNSKIVRERNDTPVTEDRTEFQNLALDRNELIRAQENDKQLQEIALSMDAADSKTEDVFFYKNNGVLMRQWKPPDAKIDEDYKTVQQIVLPHAYRTQILELAHDCPLAGHLGVRKTLFRIRRHYYWPNQHRDVARFCRTCHVCQISGKPQHNPAKAPLQPIPAIEEPFEKILIDCVGPLPKSKSGHQYLLTIMCASTRFPAAFPLRNITAKSVCDALINFFTNFGLPAVIQSDQGSNFMSKLFKQLTSVLGIKHVCSSAYRPQSQGALERLHQCIKAMLRAYCEEHSDWSAGIPLLLFAVRETIQDSLGFSPFELVFGHEPRGPLKIMKEKLLNSSTTEPTNVLNYVSEFKERLYKAREAAKENLQNAQAKMKALFDTKTQERSFEPGQKVLVFLPLQNDPLKAKYYGPYKILRKTSAVNYLIETPDRRKKTRLCHLNMMKAYYDRDEDEQMDPLPILAAVTTCETESQEDPVEGIGHRFKNSEIMNDLDKFLSHLDEEKMSDIKQVMKSSSSIFGDTPSVTNLIEHDIEIQDSRPIKQRPYRANPVKQEQIKKEITYMKQNGIIENSSSPWSSPCLVVPKPDGSSRLCTDFRKINDVTVPDNYPLPRIADCVEKIGQSKFITKIDLLRGYYQIPLTERAKRISAFVTADGFYQYNVMAFGLRNAPSTFQRLANKLIQDLDGCAVYLDDLVIFSETWPDHVQRLQHLFSRLEAANLTVNLAKSEIGKATINYLGFVVGHGKLKPLEAKVTAVLNYPVPKTRKELRRFLGMVSFYRSFCPNLSEILAPLTDMTSPNVTLDWTDECQLAFEKAKSILGSKPVLSIPQFDKPFKLRTDASQLGTGALLFQIDDEDNEHPVAYYSKKFSPHQQHFSTIEKEAFAIISSLKHFEYYVQNGLQIEVFTDHNPLVFLQKMKNENQRLLRWSLQLQEFNIVIRHIPGSRNVIADCLSRNPIWNENEQPQI